MTPLRVNALALEAPNVVGAIANQDNVHWVALKGRRRHLALRP
jgi:hypothetical protein